MWAAVAGVLGAAIALTVAQTYMQKGSEQPGSHADKPEGPPAGLPEPEKGAKPRPADGTFKADLWQELSPAEAAKRAKRWFKK